MFGGVEASHQTENETDKAMTRQLPYVPVREQKRMLEITGVHYFHPVRQL